MNKEIFGDFGHPQENARIETNEFQVVGWCFAALGGTVSIQILIDDKIVGETKNGIERKDVYRKFSAYKSAINSGFLTKIKLHGFSDGTHLLKVLAKSNNTEKLIGKKKIKLSHNKKERLFRIKKSVSDLLKSKNSEIKELTPKQELILEKNITWLFGAARSGTSWLALELLSFGTKRISEPLLERHLSVPAGIQDLRFIDNPAKNSSYFFSDKYKKTWMFFLRKLILNRIYAEVQSIDKKIIIKELISWGAGDILSECMKNSKIIILLRDGRDVVDSSVEATSQDGFMTKKLGLNKQNRPVKIKGQSKIWTLAIKDLLKTYDMKPKDIRYKIKYEDLRKNTLEEVEKIYKFLEIDIPKNELQKIVTKFTFENLPPEQKGPGKFARSATPGKWKENFNDEEKKVMEEIMGPTLTMLGY